MYHLLTAENGMSDIALRRIRVSRVRDLNDPFELLAARNDSKELGDVLKAGWRSSIVIMVFYASARSGTILCCGVITHPSTEECA